MSNKNLFSIGEVAKAVGITRKTILGYEAKGIITPDKKDGVSGNRYYTIDTFTKIRTTRTLQNFGLSLDEIRDYYSGKSDLQPTVRRLEKMRDELNLTIEKLRERIGEQNDTIREITIGPQTVYCRRYDCKTIAEKTILLRNTALEAMREYGTDTTKRMYFIEFSLTSPGNISYCVAVPPESEGEYIKHIPALKAISIFHHGAYEDIPSAINKLVSYADEKGIKLSGTVRDIFLEGPPQHKDKSKFITQIVAFAQ